MRKTFLSLCVAGALSSFSAAPLHAADRPTLLDFLSLDSLLTRFAQSAVLLLRTQLDMKYTDMSVSVLSNSVTITDVQAWPLPAWDPNGDCEVKIDKVSFRGVTLDQPDRMRTKVQLLGLNFPPICLPEDAREAVDMAGLSHVSVPRVTIDFNYGIPSADATIQAFAEIDNVGSADFVADLSYFWFDGREDLEEPVPVIFLNHAALQFEDNGLFEAVKSQLPPPMVGNGAGLFVEGAVGQALLEANQDGTLTEGQLGFVISLSKAYASFVKNPESLVIETSHEGDVYIDIEAIERDPNTLFDTLKPIVALAPASRKDLLPVDLLQKALGDTAGSLPFADRKRAGIAMVSGDGAPRNLPAGMKLLGPIAEGGDRDAALAMAKALEGSKPEDAYLWALRAGKAGAFGATAMLDRLERQMSFTRVLELQGSVSAKDQHSIDHLATIGSIRSEAEARFSGRGQTRSYLIAAMWATIGAAAGDSESKGILDELDELARLSGDEAKAAWAEGLAGSSRLAMEAWISQNLPERFAK